MIQRVKTGVIADGAITTAKMNDEVENLFSFRNRIINGDMRIHQRSSPDTEKSIPNTIAGGYITADRWTIWLANWTGGSANTAQSTDVPSGEGFTNSLYTKVTANSTTGDTSSQRYLIHQYIEGTNVADLNWGTANAKTVTVSFWVKSSVTGNYGFTLTNGSANRGYATTYTINTANTWERKTITISGDTTGTWFSNTSIGIALNFDLGVGGPTTTTLNAWQTGDIRGVTNSVKLINTLNATFYLTGVQLEAGSVATPFERRPYGIELQLCQRYFEQLTVLGSYGPGAAVLVGASAGLGVLPINYKVEKRAIGIATLVSVQSMNSNDLNYGALRTLTLYFTEAGKTGSTLYLYPSASFVPGTAGTALIIRNGTIQISAEL